GWNRPQAIHARSRRTRRRRGNLRRRLPGRRTLSVEELMAAQDCIDTIQAAAKAAGRELNEEEMVELVGDLQARIKQLQATDGMLGLEDAAMRAADEMGNEVKLAAAIEKRNALLNSRRRAELVGYIRSTWSDRPDLGLESFLVGTNVARP